MRKVFKYLSTVLAVALVAVLIAGIIGPVEIQAASKKTVRDYFGCISEEDADFMMQAVSECRKVDLNEW